MADVNKEIAIKVTATDASGPALQSLEDKLNAAKKRMIELAVAGKQNTEEFIRLQQEAGEFKRTIEGVEQSVDSVAKSGTQGMQLFSEALTAVTAGFTIATSMSALYGEENEDLQKTMMKVQASMALLQSIQALLAITTKTSAVATTANRIALALYDKTVKGTTISLKGFKAALAATGIGLIAVAAGLAYTNWEKLRELLGLPPNNTKAIAALEREIALMEANGSMIEDIEAKKIEKTIDVWYDGVMVMGTNFLLKWELSENMVRPKSASQHAIPNYVACAPRMYKGAIESLVRRMIPFADLIQLTHLKLQQVMGARDQGLKRPAIAPQASCFKPLGVINRQGHPSVICGLKFVGHCSLSVDRPLQ